MQLSNDPKITMFESFLLAEDKHLTLAAQQYLIDELDDKLDPEVEIVKADELRLKTNVGFNRTITLITGSAGSNMADVRADWTGGNGLDKSLEKVTELVNSCIASLTDHLKGNHLDVLFRGKVRPGAVSDYRIMDLHGDVSSPWIFLHEADVVDFFFKLFPQDTARELISRKIYDREKLLKAYNAKNMSEVVSQFYKVSGRDVDDNDPLLEKLIDLIVERALTTNDEKDVKSIAKSFDIREFHKLLSNRTEQRLKLAISKAGRTAEERKLDAKHDRFIFVGSEKFVPVPGTKHHKKTLDIENLYKVNRFDLNDHNALEMMHMRARVKNGNVYTILLPKGYIKAKTTDPSDLPDWLIDLIDEKKTKL